MASNINPYNINGNFPVAGQDNDSQGFRDNFTNTRNNLVFAKAELEDLQAKVLLKTALTGKSVDDSDFNNLNGQPLKLAQLRGWHETAIESTASSVVPATCSFASGNVHKVNVTGDVTIDLVDWPDKFAKMILWVVATDNDTAIIKIDGSAGTNWLGGTNIKGFNPSTSVITFATAGTYVYEITGGIPGESTTYIIRDMTNTGTIGGELVATGKVTLSSAETLVSGNAVDLSVVSSRFATSGASTATLANGVAGQIKTFVMTADGGDMVITVASAGWKSSGSGTITFNDIGDGCTMQFLNSKWYCIGNNGCVFA